MNNLEQIFVADQTDLVKCLLKTDFTFMSVENNEDEEDGFQNKIYIW